ncbi:hypothetical protein [Profundibacter sp.]|uniref:hypothetical protein n=1 Tax=Profundibacter sp. TaxID=3101071 RepID=UPI003D0CB0FA
MKNLLKSGAVAAAVLMSGAPNMAHAVSLEEYLECVSQGGGLIDCAYGNGPNPFVHIQVPRDLAPNKDEAARIQEMVKHGRFDKLDMRGAKEGGAFQGSFMQSCKTGNLLDMIEKGANLPALQKSCYERVK